MKKNMIEVSNLTKRFQEKMVLNEVSLSFEQGKIYGIIGRNGSGKTVLLKIICGLMKPTGGKVAVCGKVLGRDIEIVRNAGVIIETPGFIEEYSGLANLKFLAGLSGRYSSEYLENVMKQVGLEPKSKKKVSRYSLGMRQRLGLAQAIMEDPQILILDEPTNGLDKHGVEDFRKLMREYRDKGKTIILASHMAEDIRLLCDEVYEMENGKIE